MDVFNAEQRRTLLSGHSVVRLLIVSYFVALALGVIEGTDLTVLTDPFLSGWAAQIVASGGVLILCTLIMTGWHRQAAALVLALAMFWASYMAMMAAPDTQLGAFWRDLALIGALVMTYTDGNIQKTERKATAVPPAKATRRTSRISQAIATTRSAISRPTARTTSTANNEQTELYRKDLDIARAS